jgi:hypothetical protein
MSGDGLVCAECHAKDQAADEEQMRAAEHSSASGFGVGLGGPAFSVSTRRTERRHADGSVSVEESTEMDGWATRFFRAIFKR